MKKFGEETLEQKDAIRERLISEGYTPGSTDLYFAVERAWEKDRQGEPTLRERQYWFNMANFLRQPKPRRRYFTKAELDYMLEKLAGVNDPLGVRCLDVLNNLRRK